MIWGEHKSLNYVLYENINIGISTHKNLVSGEMHFNTPVALLSPKPEQMVLIPWKRLLLQVHPRGQATSLRPIVINGPANMMTCRQVICNTDTDGIFLSYNVGMFVIQVGITTYQPISVGLSDILCCGTGDSYLVY